VGLGISRTNVDSQWNPVYNVFHQHTTKSHLPKLISRAGRSDISGPHAGRRTDFRDKNRAIFSGELFPGEELLPEKAVLGQ